MCPASLGLAVPSHAPPGPATCLYLDALRLDVTEGTGGAILASTPGPVLPLILPGALTSVAALHCIWGGRPTFNAAGEQCKGKEEVRVQRRRPASSGVSPILHAPCQAPRSAASSHRTDGCPGKMLCCHSECFFPFRG